MDASGEKAAGVSEMQAVSVREFPGLRPQKGRHANMALPMLRQYDIGCTSGHDSLIRLWMPDNFTREDVEHIQAMWGLLIRQFERRVASTPAPDAQGEGGENG